LFSLNRTENELAPALRMRADFKYCVFVGDGVLDVPKKRREQVVGRGDHTPPLPHREKGRS